MINFTLILGNKSVSIERIVRTHTKICIILDKIISLIMNLYNIKNKKRRDRYD